MKRGCYAWFKTPLKRVCLAATPKGLCLLRWDAGRKEILTELKSRFPRYDWQENGDALKKLARQLNDFLEGRARGFNPPIDVSGTAFQRAAWNALRRIPRGRTLSYRQLAARAGRPRSIRAVANACGQNPVAVAIPCHRAVRSDGSLGGFSSGIWRKRFLLKMEGGLAD
jgi:AraC family transcriptional regulator of adaptative response/methylated-DNA-[protein]-cysteine methyltransferase